jgi:thiol:disulfide interchange protein DsbD
MKKTALMALLLLALAAWTPAPIVTFSAETSSPHPKPGDEIELVVRATIAEGWYLYANDFDASLGPMVTAIAFEPNGTYELVGGLVPVGAKRKHDEVWDGEISYFERQGEFRQRVRILKANFSAKARLKGQVCSDASGRCTLVNEAFTFQ